MKKINNKGFALTEVLIATVFIAGIFTYIYLYVMPALGKYEKEEQYDPIEIKYVGHLIEQELKGKSEYLDIRYKPPYRDLSNSTPLANIKNISHIANVYLTHFNTKYIKNDLPRNIDNDFKEYIESLPDFNTKYHSDQGPNNITYDCRLIIYIHSNGNKLFGTYKISTNSLMSNQNE